MSGFVRYFWFSSLASLLAIILAVSWLGFGSLLPLLVLAVIEITFSFDNAVVNAKVLERLSAVWQQLFLSVGIIIAIFGMRLLLPIAMVMLTANLSWHEVINLALHHPTQYAHHLEAAKPAIMGFGGAFLAMLSMHFFMNKDRPGHWLVWLERPVQTAGKPWLPVILVVLLLIILAWWPGNQHGTTTLVAGLLGAASYLSINGLMALANKFVQSGESQHYVGWAAFVMFCYLEVLDASFSFDGVLGAFAITSKVLLIVLGLGIGAVWVRSLTVVMVRRGVLQVYRYLEHGAHYAIAVLALAMLLEPVARAPQALPGLVGLTFIIGSIISSKRANQAGRK